MIEYIQHEVRLRDRAMTPASTTRRTRGTSTTQHRRRHALAQGIRRIADALDS